MKKLRWSKFWWGDWQNDAALKMCSYGARGLWIEMLAIMHAAEPQGYLVVNGRMPTARQLASLTGGAEKEVVALLRELEDAGVFSRDGEGVIFSRRMLRDISATETGRSNGRQGGNPALKTEGGGGDISGGNEGGLTPPVGRPLKLEAEAEAERDPESSLRSLSAPAAEPFDARTDLFRAGLAQFRQITGRPDGPSRAFLGRLLRTAGDDAAVVRDAIRRAHDLRPADPCAWLTRAVEAPPRNGFFALIASEMDDAPAEPSNPFLALEDRSRAH